MAARKRGEGEGKASMKLKLLTFYCLTATSEDARNQNLRMLIFPASVTPSINIDSRQYSVVENKYKR